jgi:hypothetical protein
MKVATVIINVKSPDSKLNVKKLGIANTSPIIGLTIAATIPSTAAENKCFRGAINFYAYRYLGK